jgi:hypothetical protein
MRLFLFGLLLVVTSIASAEDNLRNGTPKDCFLYSWGKGPNWTAKVACEFQLSLLNRLRPYVDDQYSDPTDKALQWVKSNKKPDITTLATVNGRKVIQVEYPDKDGKLGKTIATILLAIETNPGSEWFSPFFAAQPEIFRGQFVHGRDVSFGYIATLEWSGTGAFRCHRLFDFRGADPSLVATFHSGRIDMGDYKTETDYQEALKYYDREADFLAGIIPPKKKPVQSRGHGKPKK